MKVRTPDRIHWCPGRTGMEVKMSDLDEGSQTCLPESGHSGSCSPGGKAI